MKFSVRQNDVVFYDNRNLEISCDIESPFDSLLPAVARDQVAR